jgi:hypothetical protein
MTKMGKEQRKEKRIEQPVECQCEWGEDQIINARTIDVSFGGACITHPIVIPPEGTEIALTIYSETPVTIRGKVVHLQTSSSSPHGGGRFGIEFLGEDDDKMRRLIPIICVNGCPKEECDGRDESDE